jgi:hypothetical protein
MLEFLFAVWAKVSMSKLLFKEMQKCCAETAQYSGCVPADVLGVAKSRYPNNKNRHISTPSAQHVPLENCQ